MTRAERDWAAIIREVDKVTARAAALDRERRNVTLDEVAHGFSELAKLRQGGEPDYNERGLGTAYLLYYLARRALNTADACLALGELTGKVHILDIGAGTNAGALALAIAFPEAHFHVVAVEPSLEMARAGDFAATNLANVSLQPVAATLDDVLDQQVLPGESFDLVIMSALLPYEWRKNSLAERVEFGERLIKRLRPGGHLLAIEPRAKLDELEVLEACLERTGIEYEFGETNTAAEEDRLLIACTALFRSWFSNLSRSSGLSEEAWAMLGGQEPYALHAGSRRPDVTLTGVRRVSVAPTEQVYPPVRRVTRPPSAIAASSPQRTRIRTSTPARVKLGWTSGVVAGVASAALLFDRLL